MRLAMYRPRGFAGPPAAMPRPTSNPVGTVVALALPLGGAALFGAVGGKLVGNVKG